MDEKALWKTIKQRRKKMGLSLAGLAGRINTSVPTLSRYENGWQRFEIYTIEKIATALNCELKITLKPLKQKRTSKNPAKTINQIRRLFWDHKITKKDLKLYPSWVVERVIEYGNLEDIHSVISAFGRKEFLKIVSGCRFQSTKTASLWNSILKREGISCTKRPFHREVWKY